MRFVYAYISGSVRLLGVSLRECSFDLVFVCVYLFYCHAIIDMPLICGTKYRGSVPHNETTKFTYHLSLASNLHYISISFFFLIFFSIFINFYVVNYFNVLLG